MAGYPADWERRRKSVLKRDDYTCQNCGDRGGPYGDTELHADHVVPKSKGGTHDRTNLLTLCKPCHEQKHGHRIPTGQDERKTLHERIKAHNEEHLPEPGEESLEWFWQGMVNWFAVWCIFTFIGAAFMTVAGTLLVLFGSCEGCNWLDVLAWVGLTLFTGIFTKIFSNQGRYDTAS